MTQLKVENQEPIYFSVPIVVEPEQATTTTTDAPQEEPASIENLSTKEEITPETNSEAVDTPIPINHPYEEEIQRLKELGLDFPLISRRLLTRFNGDVNKVQTILTGKKPQIEARRLEKLARKEGKLAHRETKKREAAHEYEAYAEQIQQLQEAGYDYPVMSRRLLNRFGGDVDKVKQFFEKKKPQLDAWKAKRAEKMACKMEKKLQKMEKKQAKRGCKAEKQQIETPVQEEKIVEESIVTAQSYESEINQLQEAGYDYPIMSRRLLNRFGGDVDKVKQVLEKKKPQLDAWKAKRAEKMACKMEKQAHKMEKKTFKLEEVGAPATEEQSVEESIVTAQSYESEIKQLQEAGYDYPFVSRRLLHRFGGDVEKVKQVLEKKKPQLDAWKAKRAEKMARKMEKQAHKMEKKTFKQEEVETPATEETPVEEPIATAKPYESEVKQLQEAGYDYPFVSRRLLHRFGGDVEKVKQVLEKKKPQLDAWKAKRARKQAMCGKHHGHKEKKDGNQNQWKLQKVDKLSLLVSKHQSQIQQINSEVSPFPVIAAVLLEKFNGDTARVQKLMEGRKDELTQLDAKIARKQQKMAEKQRKKEEKQAWKQAKRCEKFYRRHSMKVDQTQ